MSWWSSKKDYELQPAELNTPAANQYTKIPPGDPISLEQALKEYPDKIEMLNIPTSDPEPDLSTKPEDIVGYCFGYVCPKKHVNSTFENITVDGYKERRACQTCGGVAKPAVVKKIFEAQWCLCKYSSFPETIDGFYPPPYDDWGWANPHPRKGYFKRIEFVHYLDTSKPRRKR